MATFTVRPEGIIRQPALTMPGNATGSEAACTALNASSIRTLLSLGTADSPSFSGMTLSGNLLFNATNTYDVGNGTYDPRTVRAATSVLSPLFNNPAAATTTLGNATYGVTVPGQLSAVTASSPGVHLSQTGGQSAIWLHAVDAYPEIVSTAGKLRLGSTTLGGFFFIEAGKFIFTQDTGNSITEIYVPSSGVWEQRTLTNAQTFRIYNTYSSDTNYERAKFTWESGVCRIGTEKGSSGGTAKSLILQTDATDRLTIDSAGAATFSGDISMSKTSAQGYIRAYYTDGVKNVAVYHNNGNGNIVSSSGGMVVQATAGNVLLSGTSGALLTNAGGAVIHTDGSVATYGQLSAATITSYDATGGVKYSRLTHDSTNGILSTSSGNLNLVPTGGTVAVTGTFGNPTLGSSANSAFRVVTSSNTYGLYVGMDGALGDTWLQAMRSDAATAYNLRLQSVGGNVLIGTGTDDASGARLQVAGSVNATGNGKFVGRLNVGGATTAAALQVSGSQIGLPTLGSTTNALVTLTAASGGFGLSAGYENSGDFWLQSMRNDGAATAYALKLQPVGGNTLVATSTDNGSGAKLQVAGGITASGNVSYAQGLSTGTVTKSANYTTTADDYCVNVTANSIDITFETAVGCANREHEVINSGSGVVTLKTTSAQTISGSASGALTLAQWKSIRVKSDGSNWLIMSQIT